jgi:integrase
VKHRTVAALPFTDWPAADQALWREAIQTTQRSVFDDEPTVRLPVIYRQRGLLAFGRWLQSVQPELCASGLDHFTPALLSKHTKILEAAGLSPFTIRGQLLEIRRVARAMRLQATFTALDRAVNHACRTARPIGDKRSRMVPARDLYELGLSLMAEPQRATARMRHHNRYRDGLAIAMLISMPMRIRNFGTLELDRHIWKSGGRYMVLIHGAEVKNKRTLECSLPAELTGAIDRYLTVVRPYLTARRGRWWTGDSIEAFWVSSNGTAINRRQLAYRIGRLTHEAFGRTVNVHLFRDVAATSIAIEDPDHVGIIPAVLGHASHRTSEKHYNQARALDAGRRYQKVIRQLRQSEGNT